MRNLNIILIIISILFFFTHNLKAEVPHFLDFKLILNQSDAGKKAQLALKSKLEKGIKSINNKQKKIQEEEKKIIEQKKIIAPEEYKKQVSALRSKVSALQKERSSLLEDIAKKRSKARKELLKNLNPIVENYMKEKKIRVVLDKKNILLGDETLDITKDIMSLLNKKLKSLNLN